MVAWAATLWDVESFYDTLCSVEILTAVLERAYTLQVLVVEMLADFAFAPHLLQLLEDQVLIATDAQETRDLIRILANLFKSRGDDTCILTSADFRLDDDASGIGALLDSVANQQHRTLREKALRNVTSVVDPLGGSYLVESLTTEMEQRIFAILDKVEAMGGTMKAIEDGWFQKEIADSAYDQAVAKGRGEKPVIGVNCFVDDSDDPEMETHPYDPETERRQIAGLEKVRAERDNAQVSRLLDELKATAADEDENLMPVTIELVKAGASMGDIVETLKGMWGTYRETPVI